MLVHRLECLMARGVLFKVFGPADVGPYDPTPAPPSEKLCDVCNQRWTEHEIVRYARAGRVVRPHTTA
jgi:hypothetical protein